MINKEKAVELYRRCATLLPSDIADGLKKALELEDSRSAKEVLKTILENIEIAKKESKPICQDTGTPFFYVSYTKDQSESEIKRIIEEATIEATEQIPLRPNAVDSVIGKNIGNKPVFHFEERDEFKIKLLMKGGGSENVSFVYSLPNNELNANRDLDGVRRCVLDAVYKAQGKGCPPYIIGVAVGGNIEETAFLSKKQLLRNLNDVNEDEGLKNLEDGLLEDINKLGIGPLGLGGKTTALGVKIAKSYRHPASFFVGVSFGCWALRRASL